MPRVSTSGAHGGRRPNAGRKRGGKNRSTVAKETLQAKALEAGVSPLEFMLGVGRGEIKETVTVEGKATQVAAPLSLRIEAMRAAAPYLHKRLAQSIDVGSAPVVINVNLGEVED